MSKNTAKIEELKKQINQLESEDAAFKELDPAEQLAVTLHDSFCANHADGCSWFYEMVNGRDNWSGHTHGQYLAKAYQVIKCCDNYNIDADVAIEVIKILK